MNQSNTTLFYIHDPMCAWCWGFRPVWQQLKAQLEESLEIVYVVGGLAPDSNQPMPLVMQKNLAATWHRIQQQIPDTKFNHQFWHPASNTHPRRSTYPACRAVLAAKLQDSQAEDSMILGIQRAYYIEAKNPSNIDLLADVARDIGLNAEQFRQDVASQALEVEFQEQLKLARQLSTQGFPSLVLQQAGKLHAIPLDYNHSHSMHQSIVNLTLAAQAHSHNYGT